MTAVAYDKVVGKQRQQPTMTADDGRRQQPTKMTAAAYNNGRQRQGPTTMAMVAYDDEGDTGLQ